jgi:acrylyl-CoA reductase (NADPH)
MDTVRAFRVYKDNGKFAGRVESLPLQATETAGVAIRVAYSSVNYKDALAATGTGKILTRFPIVPGIDVAGTVQASSDPRFVVGDKVLATGYDIGVAVDGGYSDSVALPPDWLIPLPAGLSLFEAMALGTAGFTVALCIKRLFDNGQAPDQGPILVTGATGGVGSLAVDVLSKLGFGVVALTGKSAARDYLTGLGATRVLMRDEIQYGERVLERAQWAGAIDNVGGDVLNWLTRTVQPWGNICSVGLAGGSHLNATVMPFILRGIGLLGVSSAGCPPIWRQPLWVKLADDWRPPHLDRIVTRVAELDELPNVFAAMLRGEIVGRVVVKVGGD